MATFRKRGDAWQVQIRKSGFPSLTKTFPTKAVAMRWALEQERAVELEGVPIFSLDHKKAVLEELLRRYQAEIASKKRGAKQEFYLIRALQRSTLGSLTLPKLTSSIIAIHRDRRLKSVSPGTVRRELALLRHCLEVARREWGIPISRNPVAGIQMPSPSPARERRLSDGEMERLLTASGAARAWYLKPIIELALETGMRRSELLSIRRSNTDFATALVWLPMTKNGRGRNVPLSGRAIEILRELPETDDLFFPVSTVALRQAWDRLMRRTGLPNFRFHDLRHEAISRYFEKGLSVPEVALISGHRDPRMLFRYTHLRPEDVAKKLK